jgi:AcrR family transcriptional regulator
MTRRRPPKRFQELLDAALRVFAAKGVRRTRMSDIAAEMGVAPGSLYNYVESKEALFHWIVERGVGDLPVAEPPSLPIPTPAPEVARARLREQLEAAFELPELEAACARRRPLDARQELHDVLAELYDRILRARRSMSVIERSAAHLPELYDTYFATLRRRYFERMRGYIAARQRAGAFRASLDPDVAARFVVESITFFARHRFGDPDPPPLPDEAEVRAQVLELSAAGLLAKPSRSKEKRR